MDNDPQVILGLHWPYICACSCLRFFFQKVFDEFIILHPGILRRLCATLLGYCSEH